jgi:acetoin utilization protein AcuB
MFVVYSPEGQSFIGAAHNLPVLKVDPATRVPETSKAGLEDMNMEPDHSNPRFQADQALKHYRQTQQGQQERHVAVKVAEIMSSPVHTVEPDALLDGAWAMLQRHEIYYLPVVTEGRLLGICSKSDVLKKIIVAPGGEAEIAQNLRVAEIMQPEVVTATLETEIRQIAMALTQYHIGALPIMDQQGQLVGIVTLADLVRRLSQEPPIELYV